MILVRLVALVCDFGFIFFFLMLRLVERFAKQAAFEKIKENLMSYPVVQCPDFEFEFQIQCDVSNVGLGSVLLQHIENEERVIAYASLTLNKAERNYSTTEKECLAVLHSLDVFRPYIEGAHFTHFTTSPGAREVLKASKWLSKKKFFFRILGLIKIGRLGR